MEYYTADTYKNWKRVTEPYEKDGKLYTKVKEQCDRCTNGIYAIGVENGQIKPHPAYNGVCLKCGGTGFLTKEVRLYTEKEYMSMKRAAAARKERAEKERKAKMEAEFDHNKELWLKTNGFSEDGFTYVVTGNSYAIKDQLKEAGFKYDSVLRWHRATPEGYEENTIKVNLDDVIEISAWGEGHYLSSAKKFIDNLLKEEDDEQEESEWYGEVGGKVKEHKVRFTNRYSYQSQWGLSNIYTFKDDTNHTFVWFTTKGLSYELNTPLILTGTIKEHKTYKDTHQTIVTRCKVKGED